MMNDEKFLPKVMIYLLQARYSLAKLSLEAGYGRTYFFNIKQGTINPSNCGLKCVRDIFDKYSNSDDKRVIREFSKHPEICRKYSHGTYGDTEFLRSYRLVSENSDTPLPRPKPPKYRRCGSYAEYK